MPAVSGDWRGVRPVTDWVVRRWARFGHNRLYAATPGGTNLGYFDLATGRFHSDDMSNLPLLRAAIEDHFANQPQAAPAAPISPPPPVASATPPTSVTTMAPAMTPVPAPVTASAPGQAPGLPSNLSGSSAGSPGSEAVSAGTGWHDLADVRPGAAARERAIAEREAQGLVRHVLARLLDAKTEERSWRIGADGEEFVAAQIATAGEGWRALHAVRVGDRGSDIDHVVIGPGGVFTVNAKNHPKASVWVGGDTFMVNGRRQPYVRNSRFEARRASRLLAEQVGFPVPVTGLIAVVGARRGFTVKCQPEDGAVVVLGRRRLGRYLRSQPPRLGRREIDAIHEVARRSDTWQR